MTTLLSGEEEEGEVAFYIGHISFHFCMLRYLTGNVYCRLAWNGAARRPYLYIHNVAGTSNDGDTFAFFFFQPSPLFSSNARARISPLSAASWVGEGRKCRRYGSEPTRDG
jgi:hypothetical protein